MICVIAIIGVFFVIGGIIIFLMLVSVASEIRRDNDLRQEHNQTHPPVADEIFLKQSGISKEQASVALGVRHGVAEAMEVEPETVYASDTLGYIVQFDFDELPVSVVKCHIEDALHVRFHRPFWKPIVIGREPPADYTVGEWAKIIVENWDSPHRKTMKRKGGMHEVCDDR